MLLRDAKFTILQKKKNMVHYNFFIQVSDYILDLLVC